MERPDIAMDADYVSAFRKAAGTTSDVTVNFKRKINADISSNRYTS